jgi:hypothetical protein
MPTQDSPPPRVLVIGIDPEAVTHLGIDPVTVHAALDAGQRRFAAAGITSDLCLVGLDPDSALREMTKQLKAHACDCVVIGGGIRKPEPLMEFFEEVVNLVRRHAPAAAIAFNTNAENSVDAARRWINRPLPDA